MSFDRERPYNDLPDLPPAVELETRPVLKQANAATRALLELKGIGRLLPDQGVLVNSLVLQEARASSEIESIVTTTDDLYRALDAAYLDKASPATKEVLRYREALWTGYGELRDGRPIRTNTMVQIVRTIRQTDIGVRDTPGTRVATADGRVIYTPPEGEELIRDKLANLEQFIHGDSDLDPLVRLAVMHYQFEAIHPFGDGNGRTGRVLNALFLVHFGLLDVPVLYLSGYLLQHRARYYELLRRVTEEGAWEEWLLYMLVGIEVTARDTHARVQEILNAQSDALAEAERAGLPALREALVWLLFRRPYCKTGLVVEEGIAQRQTAARHLKALADLGIVRAERHGRETYYINGRLLGILRRPMALDGPVCPYGRQPA